MTCWSQILASKVRPGVCTAVSSRFFFFHGRLMHRHRPFCTAAIQVRARTRLQLSKHIGAVGPTSDFGQAPYWRGMAPDRNGAPKSILSCPRGGPPVVGLFVPEGSIRTIRPIRLASL